MVLNLQNIFTQAALIGAIALTSNSLSAQTVTNPLESSPSPTVPEARDIIKKSDSAANNIFIMGMIGAFNPTGTVNTPTGKIDIGIKKSDCERIVQNQTIIADMQTYKMAQKVLIEAGQLSEAAAAAQLRTQTNIIKTVEPQLSTLSKLCDAHGISMEAKP